MIDDIFDDGFEKVQLQARLTRELAMKQRRADERADMLRLVLTFGAVVALGCLAWLCGVRS